MLNMRTQKSNLKENIDVVLAVPPISKLLFNDAISIYSNEFSDASYTNPSEIKRTWISGRRRVWCIRSDGFVVGCGITMNFPDTCSVLLEYLAISPSFQSRGFGSFFLNFLHNTLKEEGVKNIYVETRRPDPLSNDEITKQNSRRVAFYGKNGYQGIPSYPIHYCPSFSTQGVVLRVLMKHSLQQEENNISDIELKQVLLDIFLLSYMGVDSYLVSKYNKPIE